MPLKSESYIGLVLASPRLTGVCRSGGPRCAGPGTEIIRLDKVRTVSHNFGYGVGIDMDSLLSKYARK
jgi:hypothetical protein